MEHNKIQKIVNDVFKEAFTHTPLSERLKDIEGECRELCNFTDVKNLKEEAGDLLASLIQLCNESEWDIADLIKSNEEKIKRRMPQYKSLGRKTNVAILGGAFNPVTKAHVCLAKLILDAGKWADEVWFMPVYQHMDGKNMVSPEYRMEMLKIATQEDPRMKVCDYEIKHELGGETYHLLNKIIHDDEFEHYRFSFVIGLDRANTIESWYKSYELFKLDVPFMVVARPGYERNIDINWYLQKPHKFIKIDEEDNCKFDISSTEARKLLKKDAYVDANCRIEDVLDKSVHDYTLTYGLYR